MFGWVLFPVERHAQLFRRALLEVFEGWRLLAQTPSTRSMSELCAAVRILLRVLHILLYPTWMFRYSRYKNTAHVGAVRCGCSVLPSDLWYQLSGCSILLSIRGVSNDLFLANNLPHFHIMEIFKRDLSELSWFLPPPAETGLQIIDHFLAHNYRRFWFLGLRVDGWKRQQQK